MSWGPCYFYYRCLKCGCYYKYAQDLIPVLKDSFGTCPKCGIMGCYEKDGARALDDSDYFEVEDT